MSATALNSLVQCRSECLACYKDCHNGYLRISGKHRGLSHVSQFLDWSLIDENFHFVAEKPGGVAHALADRGFIDEAPPKELGRLSMGLCRVCNITDPDWDVLRKTVGANSTRYKRLQTSSCSLKVEAFAAANVVGGDMECISHVTDVYVVARVLTIEDRGCLVAQ